MGIFNKNRTDGQTSDGATGERKGIIDAIRYNGAAEELVWKFPYDNLTIGAQLTVNQSQDAVFLKGGAVCDVFGPGTHTLSTNNIPILQKLINLPFGGKTPFVAEVWYVNKTVKRNQKWGTATPIKLRDPQWGIIIPVRSYGEYGITIRDSNAFLKQLVGTQHVATTDDVLAQFKSLIISQITDTISKYIVDQKISVIDLPAKIDEVGNICRGKVSDEFAAFGMEVTNFNIDSINYPDDDPGVQKINEAMASAQQRKIEGFTYEQEQSFDVLKTAAGNEGGGSGLAGAGISLGVGLGVGGAMGNQMGNMANQMNTGGNHGAVPPPPPGTASFFVLINNEQLGPFDLTQLAQMAQQGQLTRDIMVWKQGMAQWQKAGEVPDMTSVFGAPPPPPQPPPSPAQ